MRDAMKAPALVLCAGAALAVLVGCGADDTREPRELFHKYPPTGVTKSFDFTITEGVAWEVGPGAIYDAIAYNKQLPGPPIEVTAGDHITIRLTNNAKKAHSIHTHVVSFTSGNDGVDGSMVMPGETKTFEWDALYAGTFPY